MSSWFSNVDVDDIPDNPNELPNNTYKFQVTGAKLGLTKDNSKTGITFKYLIIEGPWATFFPLTDWVRVPDNTLKVDEVQRILSYLKMRLLAFGFSPDEIQEFGPGKELKTVGRIFYGTTNLQKKDDGNTNIKVIKFDPLNDGVDTMVDFPDDDPDM